MRMKYTTENIGGASAIERLLTLAQEFDMLTGDTRDVHTAAEICHDSFDRLIFDKTTEANDHYLIGPGERRHLNFQVTDVMVRASETDERATILSERLFEIARELRDSRAKQQSY